MRLAYLIASRTNCMKRAVGAVIVRDSRIVAAGYNGTPFGMINCNEGGCARCNGMAAAGANLDSCYCLHAEENAIIEAGRDKCQGSTIYVTTIPCLMCAKKVAQSGITRIVFDRDYPMPVIREFLGLMKHISLEQHSP
jgi:dCMP deaminase